MIVIHVYLPWTWNVHAYPINKIAFNSTEAIWKVIDNRFMFTKQELSLIENSQHTIKSAFIDNEHKCFIGLKNTGSLIFTWKQTFFDLCTQSIFWSLCTQSWLFPKSRSLCFRKNRQIITLPSQPFYITYYMASVYMYVRTLSKQSANNMKYIGNIHWFDDEYCTDLFFIFTSFPRENVIKVKW